VGGGVYEMKFRTIGYRLYFGYRLYYCRRGLSDYLLLHGGDKNTKEDQTVDIERAKARENVASDDTSTARSHPSGVRFAAPDEQGVLAAPPARRSSSSALVVGGLHTAFARNASASDIRLWGVLPLPTQRYGPMCRARPDSSAALTNSASLAESGPAFSSMNGMSRRCILSHRPESYGTVCLLRFRRPRIARLRPLVRPPFLSWGGFCKRLYRRDHQSRRELL
jgi:hypothetical protein